MHDLPTDWDALCAVVLLLGIRHGFDADHLAAIDGLTRLASARQHRHSGWCGALFSLGHGGIVLTIALAVGLASRRWTPPVWLTACGAWLSIVFLLVIGLLNLRALLSAAPGCVVAMVGLRGKGLSRLMPTGSAWGVAGIGALFALSFDTLSQAALFAITATQFGGVQLSLALGLLFVLGMLIADGLNGWWISRLITRADQAAARASRVMTAAVAGVSLLVAGLGIARLLSPALDTWSDGKGLLTGAIVLAVVALSYLAARASVRLSPVHQPGG